MKKIPDEIKRYRLHGTEIKSVGNHFYLYRVSSKWDKELKKYRKVTLGYIGRVTSEGIIEAHHRNEKSKPISYSRGYSLEYGSTWLLRTVGQDILDNLQKHFGSDATWIYSVALLRAARHCAFRYLEHYYNVSYLSVVYPKLPMSSSSLSNKMQELGMRRDTMVNFMREYIPSKNFYAIFDGTSIVCNSNNISDAQRGYNSHGCHDPQLNLMYALALEEKKICPIFYKNYPGSVRDVSAFQNMMCEMGITSAVVLADKGFYSEANGNELDTLNIPYIMPLRRNSLEYEKTPLLKPGTTGFDGRFLHNGRIIWYWTQPCGKDPKCRYFVYMDETLRHMESIGRMTGKIGNETAEELKEIQNAQLLFGTFVLKSSLLSAGAEETYKIYKTREDVEQLFDIYKDEEDFKTTGMHSKETMEATFFLNHLSTMLLYKLYEKLQEKNMLKQYAASKICDILWDVRVSSIGNEWQMEPIPKLSRKAIIATGLQPPKEIV